MSNISRTALLAALALVVPLGASAYALEGYDGDNNPVPYSSYAPQAYSDAYAAFRGYDASIARRHHGSRAPRASHRARAAVRNEAYAWSGLPDVYGETKPGDPYSVYWRGRYVGTDPDPQVRIEMLRNAISGGG